MHVLIRKYWLCLIKMHTNFGGVGGEYQRGLAGGRKSHREMLRYEFIHTLVRRVGSERGRSGFIGHES